MQSTELNSKRLLEGKVCLITGCSRGIGNAMLVRFAQAGAIVYANARSPGCIDDQCKQLAQDYDTKVIPIYYDVTDSIGIKTCIQRIHKAHKRLDVLVNNAGIMKDALIGMVTDELMQEIFSVNVFAVMNQMQYAVKLMKRNSSGSIINLSSIVGVNGNSGQLVYSASKGAIIALTKTASKELAESHIRVNAIAPGMIDTDMFRSIGEDKIQDYLKKIGFGNLGRPEQVADMAVFLASDLSEYVTGQVIGVDGGAVI